MSKGIFKAFVTPSFIHSADDDATVDVARRKVTLLKHAEGQLGQMAFSQSLARVN